MKRAVVFGLVGAALLFAPGCASQDALMKEFIANLNLCAEMIEKKEPKEKVLAAIDRTSATVDKINKLKLSKEQLDALIQKYENELKRVNGRLEAAQKARKLEGTDDDLPPITSESFLKK
jgi:hypothetical protein